MGLAVTAVSLARQSSTHWAFVVIAVAAFALTTLTKVHPFFILFGGALLGFGVKVVLAS